MAHCSKDGTAPRTQGSSVPQQRAGWLGRLPALWRQGLGKKACGGGADQHLHPQYVQEFANETWRTRTGQSLPDHLVLLLWSLIVSLYPLGGLLGALLAGPLAVTLGR